MRQPIALAILIGATLLPGCGGDSQATSKIEPLKLTPEQVAEIQSQDQSVEDEETGSKVAPVRTKKKKR
ncbi:hypothetical protein P12x_002631 [Tundrisphaera lichenicola]|uniref:hypothetical protein n=1 Tax=Tundrisphaera lichenicola TaxID=2029860 RepID=UPI003EB8E8CA